MMHNDALDMTYDEYTYEVECLIIGETGDAVSEDQFEAIIRGYEKCLTPWECFEAIRPYNEIAA